MKYLAIGWLIAAVIIIAFIKGGHVDD